MAPVSSSLALPKGVRVLGQAPLPTSGKSWFQLWSRSRWSWRRATDLSTSRHNRIPMLWHLCHHRWHFPKGFASWAKLLGMVKFPPYDGSPPTHKHTPTRTRNNTPRDDKAIRHKTITQGSKDQRAPLYIQRTPFIYESPLYIQRAPFIYQRAPMYIQRAPLYIREPPVYTESPPLYTESPLYMQRGLPVYQGAPCIYREPPTQVCMKHACKHACRHLPSTSPAPREHMSSKSEVAKTLILGGPWAQMPLGRSRFRTAATQLRARALERGWGEVDLSPSCSILVH